MTLAIDSFKAAELAIEKIIGRGEKADATSHERWLASELVGNARFRQRLTERLARGRS